MADVDLTRIQVVEPDPGRPAAENPAFGGHPPSGRAAIVALGLALLGLAGAIWLYLANPLGPFFAAAVFLTDLLLLAMVVKILWTRLRFAALALLPFADTVIPSDGLYFAGAKVSLRSADGQWLVVRLPRAERLQLAAQRRAWLLGPDADGRVFVQLPGLHRSSRGRSADGPASGAVLVAPPHPISVSPRKDKVLRAHRAWVLRSALLMAFVWAVPLLVLVAGFIRAGGEGDVPQNLAGICFVVFVLGFDLCRSLIRDLWRVRPLPSGRWTEIAVIPDARMPAGQSFACRVPLPDGRVCLFSANSADHGLSVNVWATRKLWLIGDPAPGKFVRFGLPGHAVLGAGKFGRVLAE